jgi:two-component system, response regulator YesN
MEKKVILLVEDDVQIRGMIEDALKAEYHLLLASKCSEAVAFIKDKFHLALLDYVLPDGNAFDIIKSIKEKKEKIPVILMTAYHQEQVMLKALRAGVADYIKKPLKLKALKNQIKNICDGGLPSEDTAAETVKNKKDFLIDSIGDYISQSYAENLSLDTLAKMSGMNKFNFCRVFKGRFGQSFISYLNSVRIRNAAELLQNSDLNITDVSFL